MSKVNLGYWGNYYCKLNDHEKWLVLLNHDSLSIASNLLLELVPMSLLSIFIFFLFLYIAQPIRGVNVIFFIEENLLLISIYLELEYFFSGKLFLLPKSIIDRIDNYLLNNAYLLNWFQSNIISTPSVWFNILGGSIFSCFLSEQFLPHPDYFLQYSLKELGSATRQHSWSFLSKNKFTTKSEYIFFKSDNTYTSASIFNHVLFKSDFRKTSLYPVTRAHPFDLYVKTSTTNPPVLTTTEYDFLVDMARFRTTFIKWEATSLFDSKFNSFFYFW